MHSQVVELGILQNRSWLTKVLKAGVSSDQERDNHVSQDINIWMTTLIMPLEKLPSLSASRNKDEEQH